MLLILRAPAEPKLNVPMLPAAGAAAPKLNVGVALPVALEPKPKDGMVGAADVGATGAVVFASVLEASAGGCAPKWNTPVPVAGT